MRFILGLIIGVAIGAALGMLSQPGNQSREPMGQRQRRDIEEAGESAAA